MHDLSSCLENSVTAIRKWTEAPQDRYRAVYAIGIMTYVPVLVLDRLHKQYPDIEISRAEVARFKARIIAISPRIRMIEELRDGMCARKAESTKLHLIFVNGEALISIGDGSVIRLSDLFSGWLREWKHWMTFIEDAMQSPERYKAMVQSVNQPSARI